MTSPELLSQIQINTANMIAPKCTAGPENSNNFTQVFLIRPATKIVKPVLLCRTKWPSELYITLHNSWPPEVIKLFMLNSAEHEIYPAHKC